MESIGTIITRVYTSRAQIPIQGATVAVTRPGASGRHTLLAMRVSDQSGLTAPIPVETPPPQEGLSPGGPVPFASVDLWAHAEGFEAIRIQGIQVFPGTETYQALELVPLPEHALPGSRDDQVQITPQNL